MPKSDMMLPGAGLSDGRSMWLSMKTLAGWESDATTLRAAVDEHQIRFHVAASPRLHRPVGVARLRHAAVQRHVGMDAQPAIAGPGKHDCRAAGARKRPAVGVIAGAGPRRDHGCHRAVG